MGTVQEKNIHQTIVLSILNANPFVQSILLYCLVAKKQQKKSKATKLNIMRLNTSSYKTKNIFSFQI